MHADKHNAEVLKSTLDKYSASSGQKVSENKSSIFFNANTNVEVKEEVYQMLNIVTESLSDKYFGLLAVVEANRSDYFAI